MKQDINTQTDKIRQLLFASFSIDVRTAKKMLKPFTRGEYDLAKTFKRFGQDISQFLKS